jgi:carboxymethylenebutenolidase
MPRQTAADFAAEVLELFDQYVHGGISRRGFLDGAGKYAVGGMTAIGLLEALAPDFAMAQQVAPTDARIVTSTLAFDSPKGYGKASGYLARPAQAPADKPAQQVIHENRGLNPHIEDITRRLALEGYLAFAPDALFSLGGYPGDEDKARELFGQLDPAKVKADFLAAAPLLKTQAGTNGRVGAVGFCFGGGIVNVLATQWPDLNAGVPFYGAAPDLADVPHIRAPLLMHFAGNDARINGMWPPYEAALKGVHATYEAFVYPGVEHGFNNDTTPRFDAKAAGLAWRRTLAFLAQTLKTEHVA